MRVCWYTVLVVLAVLFIITISALGQQTPSCTIFVQPGESIQEAIDKAPEGAVICLGAGAWEENIIITKSLTLRSMGQSKSESLLHNTVVFQVTGIANLTLAQRHDIVTRVVQVFENRVSLEGLSGVQIKKIEANRIKVTFPNTLNTKPITDLLGRPGRLEFLKVIEAGTSPTSDLVPTSATQEVLYNREGIPYIVESTPLLTGAAIADANVRTSQSMQTAGQLYISLSFNQEGAQQFVEVLRHLKGDNPDTPQNEGDLLAIVLDHVIYSAPRITESIKTAAAQGWRSVQNSTTISGKFTKEEATRIAIVLRAGTLSHAVNVIKIEYTLPVIYSTNDTQTVQIRVPEGVESVLVSFEGLDLQGGILIEGQTKVKILDCIVSGSNNSGISLLDAAEATISGCTISENEGFGINLEDSAQATISNSTISENEWSGIELFDSAQATISNSTISQNGQDGIELRNLAQMTIEGSKIHNNVGYGVALYQQPCFDTDSVFSGHVSGKQNVILGPWDPDGNGGGSVCPEDLSFLMTEEGGKLDRQK